MVPRQVIASGGLLQPLLVVWLSDQTATVQLSLFGLVLLSVPVCVAISKLNSLSLSLTLHPPHASIKLERVGACHVIANALRSEISEKHKLDCRRGGGGGGIGTKSNGMKEGKAQRPLQTGGYGRLLWENRRARRCHRDCWGRPARCSACGALLTDIHIFAKN